MNFKKNADGFAAFGGVSRVLNALLARFRGVCNRSNRESERLACKDPERAVTYYLQFGGESTDQVRDRMTETLTEIMEKGDHYSVLAVSHGGACLNFLKGVQDPSEELKKGFTNCCIFIYDYEDGKFSLVKVERPEV